jgi:hypothetical protein
MVIVVEEKRTNPASILNIIAWILVLILIGGATYYVFFQDPTVIEFQAPPELVSIDVITHIKDDLDPSTLRLPDQGEHLTIPAPDSTVKGRTNPFLGFSVPVAPAPVTTGTRARR